MASNRSASKASYASFWLMRRSQKPQLDDDDSGTYDGNRHDWDGHVYKSDIRNPDGVGNGGRMVEANVTERVVPTKNVSFVFMKVGLHAVAPIDFETRIEQWWT